MSRNTPSSVRDSAYRGAAIERYLDHRRRFGVGGLSRPEPRSEPSESAHREAARQWREKRYAPFGVGNYRGSSGPGQVGRRVIPQRRGRIIRPHQGWKRRTGFVGQGASTSLPNTPSGHPVNPGTPSGMPHGNPGCMPPTAPPYPCPPTVDPRWWDFNRGCPIDHDAGMGCTDGVTMGCNTAQECGNNVIGANTLGTEGVPPGEVVPLQVTAGDATKFHTKSIYFEALPFADPDMVDVMGLPQGRPTMPLILVDALVGRISQLRRGGSPDVGVTQGGYANTKGLVSTDWAPFTSTTEHNLALLFYNPNRAITVHVFVNLWGDI